MPSIVIIPRAYPPPKSSRRWSSRPYAAGLAVVPNATGGYDVVQVTPDPQTGVLGPQPISHHETEQEAERAAKARMGMES